MTKPSHPDAIDQSWGYADPKAAYAAGIRVVSMYLSHDPSKDVTSAKVKAYHAAGIAVLLNWEAQAGAPLNGAAQGQADAAEAVRQAQALIAAVGYRPANKLSIIFSCDRDTNSSNYPAIDAYYNATKNITRAAGYLNGVYGEYDLISHLHSKGLTDVEWQSYAWSGGRLSPEADLYQYLNGQHLAGASVDFDKVEHAATLGAWWPPSSSQPDPMEEFMSFYASKAEFEAAIEAKVITAIKGANWPSWRDGAVNGHAFDTTLRWAIDDKVSPVAMALSSVAQILSDPTSGIGARVASLQAAVAKLPTTAALAGANAAEVADAVITKVKALIWKAN